MTEKRGGIRATGSLVSSRVKPMNPEWPCRILPARMAMSSYLVKAGLWKKRSPVHGRHPVRHEYFPILGQWLSLVGGRQRKKQ
ncbi:MAG: hypothetical protein C6W57_06525 [Caldibacillus debilis]|nr:MAG: hypothetical protein C6W57_06525 [Caldibacillus debilis]